MRDDALPGPTMSAVFATTLLTTFVASGLVDWPRAFMAGSISGLAALVAIQIAVAAVVLLGTGMVSRLSLWYLAPWAAFLGWMLLRSTVDWPDRNGIQNAMAYVLFFLTALLAGTLASMDAVAMKRLLARGFAVMDTLALGLALINFARFGLPTEVGDDLVWTIGPRALALVALAPVGWHLAGWCHGRPGAGLRALVWIVAVMASLSRAATGALLVAAGLAFVARMWVAPGRLFRQLPWLVAGVVMALALVLVYRDQFRERFLEGYNNVEVGGVAVSTSGRNMFWPVVIDSAMEHPLVGGGLGSSQAALSQFDPVRVGHPHNDYLRVWHDGGAIGLGCVMLAFVTWLIVLGRHWARTVRGGRQYPEVRLAAVLALVGIMLTSITDNGFVYGYVMAPIGLLVGAGLGLGTAREAASQWSSATRTPTKTSLAGGLA